MLVMPVRQFFPIARVRTDLRYWWWHYRFSRMAEGAGAPD